ncbi:sensor histidine kinase [Mangrovivirga sp. M17]|uniref:Sensor histidine kinase n=1 Tax=Mangrovivirga halotolerans TaxID=2993936 RepID=A0ABT3RQU1_9BACT|nr:sensor histidine kinase [Mangrovivirga halotolerans]MCX2744134.1 sensor histidine kinase [Mangrovivirga halotolerans]
MIQLIKKYRGFIYGFFLTAILAAILIEIGFLLIDESEVIVNILIFTFWWIMISLPIYHIKYLKKRRVTVFKISGLLLLLIITILVDSLINIPDNPVSIFLLITFWIGVSYVFFPKFFNKYKYYIIGIYCIAFAYWSYVRLFSESFSVYQLEEKDLAISLLLIPIPVFIVLWIYEQWVWLRTLKSEKTQAELAMLKMQVNPHFFFNTLNNLYSLTIKKSDEAPDVVLKLSDMMRYTIYEGKKETVSVEDEIEYLKNYIDLHRIRYHKTVDIKFDVDITESGKIAPLLFIILLENAFKHGVETLSEDAFIKINFEINKNHFRFVIENNYEESDPDNTEPGIGLENLKKRLKLIYPENHELITSKKKNIYKAELTIFKS